MFLVHQPTNQLFLFYGILTLIAFVHKNKCSFSTINFTFWSQNSTLYLNSFTSFNNCLDLRKQFRCGSFIFDNTYFAFLQRFKLLREIIFKRIDRIEMPRSFFSKSKKIKFKFSNSVMYVR